MSAMFPLLPKAFGGVYDLNSKSLTMLNSLDFSLHISSVEE